MSWRDHTIDWHAFRFATQLFVGFIIFAVTGHYGLEAAKSRVYSDARKSAIIVERPIPKLPPVTGLSSTTPQRVINTLTIQDVVPQTGKLIAADLVHMKLYLFSDGTTTATFAISHKGRPGTPWETPSGFYAVQTKEKNHFSSIGKVYMPYSMQFYGNYFIHGETYYPDGTPTAASFSGGCIRLATADAEKVFAFADTGTKVFVYDSKQQDPLLSLSVDTVSAPVLKARAYLIADLDTGDVFTEKNATTPLPIASVTKLMTALVANETISFDKKLSVTQGNLVNPPDPDAVTEKTFLVGDLFYPLLMQSSNGIAETLASYYGPKSFVRWMNTTAQALGMSATTFADTTGLSPDNVSTTEDLYRLAAYLIKKKSFILKITRTPTKTITADDGTKYTITNLNAPANDEPFEGGKVGHTNEASDTMLSVLSITTGATQRHIAVVVLGSEDQAQDTKHLAEWITQAASQSAQTACATCSVAPHYRKIQL